MSTSNSIGIKAAEILANLTHAEQDLVLEATRDPNEARVMHGELARMRAEDAFELGHEAKVRQTVERVALETVLDGSGDLPKNERRNDTSLGGLARARGRVGGMQPEKKALPKNTRKPVVGLRSGTKVV